MLKLFSSNIRKRSVRFFASATRGKYGILTNSDVDHFKSILKEPLMVLTDEEDLQSYNTDWLRVYKGQSKLVLRPKTTEQVSKILEYCNKRNLAIVPQGGNTGLVGGSVPVFDEIILSTQLMNQVLFFEPTMGVLTCQAGCVLESLNDYLNPSQFMMPLDLGAKGTCQIGGNVSTNAGGIRLLRYGSLQSSVLGVEAVLANGSVVDFLSTMRKDNSGYHLKHLFIGSEGTLGVVTKVSVLCAKLPNSVNLAMCSCESFDHVVRILKAAREKLGEILSAFEVMDEFSIDCAEKYLGTKVPIGRSGFYIIVETSGSFSEHDQDKLTRFIDSLDGIIVDGTLALDSSKITNLWKFRESIPLGLVKLGYVYKYDVSLPLSEYYEVVSFLRKELSGDVRGVYGYGHIGDGNLHLNVIDKECNEKTKNKIESILYNYVVKHKGSISAEHGVGIGKRDHLHMSKSKECFDLMRNMKHVMDPNHILNPYKVLPLTH